MSKNNLDTDVLKIAMYLRLSQDDEKYDKGFKVESNSISNQRLQINDFIDKNEDMELIEEYVDDGYSGINFERPAFKKMMEDVITGRINCIVVKDLSRFGRDYIDSGRYLQRVFPSLDIRFIALNDNYDSYNINADDAACAIAEAVHAEKLAFLSDIEGVYRDKDDPSSLISELHIQDARKLIEDGYVGGGMIPKLNNCIEAIEHGVNRVHILDGRIPHCLLLEIFTNKGVGTAILSDDAEKFFDSDK